MKKLYRTTLFAGVLAFGLAACGDDVQIVEPADPPPPALSVSFSQQNVNVAVGQTVSLGLNIAGGADGATATWSCSTDDAGVASVSDTGSGCSVVGQAQGSTAISASVTKGTQTATATASINVADLKRAEVSIAQMPTNMTEEVNVVVNMDPHDETPTRLELLFIDGDGVETIVDGQTFAASSPAAAPGEEAPAEQVQVIVFTVNTAAVDRDPDTQLMSARILNGEYTVRARVFTVQSGEASPSATNDRTATVSNPDYVVVEHRPELGDANTALIVDGGTGYRYWGGGDLVFQAHPILFSGASPHTVEIEATSADGEVTFADDTAETPFLFTVDYEDNFDLVEDIIGNGGHTISVANVSDPDAIDVTPATQQTLAGFYIDMTAPDLTGLTGINVDNDPTITSPAPTDYFSTGTFALAGVVDDAGSGIAMDLTTFAALFDEEEVMDDVAGIADLGEDGDANWQVALSRVVDRVGNVARPLPGDDYVEVSDFFNVDKTGPAFSDIMPVADETFVYSGSGGVTFTVTDPDLPEDADGSGVGAVEVDGDVADLSNVDDDYTYDLLGAGHADGVVELELWAADEAIVPNESETTVTFILDTTPPSLALNDTPNNTSTSAASVLRTISGILSDENGIAEDMSSISIYHGTCAAPGALVDVGDDPGEVDRNEVAIDGDFDEAFRFYNTGVANDAQTFCFVVEAGDTALDINGDPEPNMAEVTTELTITWNP
jgi:hypothetical protein